MTLTNIELPADKEQVWIDVDNLSVCVTRTDEGVVTDIYSKNDLSEPIATTYAFFNEVDVDVDVDVDVEEEDEVKRYTHSVEFTTDTTSREAAERQCHRQLKTGNYSLVYWDEEEIDE